MNQITKTSKTITCLIFFYFFFLISFFIFLSSFDKKPDSTAYYVSIVPLVMVFFLAVLIVFAVRTTVVAWITVVVLLDFVGKRRRVLAKDGSKITSDIAFYFVKVVVKDKGLVAFGCVTIMSVVIMALCKMGHHVYLFVT
ncbi:hypothetical protein OROGR_032276 [Orobanche gracilis]